MISICNLVDNSRWAAKMIVLPACYLGLSREERVKTGLEFRVEWFAARE